MKEEKDSQRKHVSMKMTEERGTKSYDECVICFKFLPNDLEFNLCYPCETSTKYFVSLKCLMNDSWCWFYSSLLILLDYTLSFLQYLSLENWYILPCSCKDSFTFEVQNKITTDDKCLSVKSIHIRGKMKTLSTSLHLSLQFVKPFSSMRHITKMKICAVVCAQQKHLHAISMQFKWFSPSSYTWWKWVDRVDSLTVSGELSSSISS